MDALTRKSLILPQNSGTGLWHGQKRHAKEATLKSRVRISNTSSSLLCPLTRMDEDNINSSTSTNTISIALNKLEQFSFWAKFIKVELGAQRSKFL